VAHGLTMRTKILSTMGAADVPQRSFVRRFARRRVIVPAISLATVLGVALLLWPSSRGTGASQTVDGTGNRAANRANRLPAARPVVEPLPPLVGSEPSAPTVTSRWESERAEMKRKMAAATGGQSQRAVMRDAWRQGSRLEHRGPKIATQPLSSISTSQETPVAVPRPGTIAPSLVKKVVWSHASEVQGCFNRAAMEHSDLHGRLTIRATVDPTGHVLSASPATTIEDGARLRACVVSAFESWTFPAPEGGVNGDITYSFSFE
jgi:hypothetical protein